MWFWPLSYYLEGRRVKCPETKPLYRQETVEVGSFSPNPFGLCEMLGNVLELMVGIDPESMYFESAHPPNPIMIQHNRFKAVRGGAWYLPATYLRASWRGCFSRSRKPSAGIGFRVACDAE